MGRDDIRVLELAASEEAERTSHVENIMEFIGEQT